MFSLFGYSCQLLVVHSSTAFSTDIPFDSKRINKMSSHTFEFLVMDAQSAKRSQGHGGPPAAKHFHIILFGMLLRVLFFSFFTFTPFTFITLPDYRHFGRARFNSSTSRSHCLILFLLHLYSFTFINLPDNCHFGIYKASIVHVSSVYLLMWPKEEFSGFAAKCIPLGALLPTEHPRNFNSF